MGPRTPGQRPARRTLPRSPVGRFAPTIRVPCPWPQCGRAQPAQALAQRARGEHVEAVRRLVQDDVRRVVDKRPRQRGLHAFALAEALGAALQERRHVEHLRQGLGACVGRVGAHALQARVVDDVLARAQPRVQAAPVGQHAHARQRLARALCHVNTVHHHAARVGCDQARQHAQRRRLAGAVRAEQAGDVAVTGLKGDVLHRMDNTLVCAPTYQ